MFSMLPEKEEVSAGEKVLEERRRRAKEKGHPIMDSPCGAVGEGGRDGHKTRRGKESPDLEGLIEEVRVDANRDDEQLWTFRTGLGRSCCTARSGFCGWRSGYGNDDGL